MPELPEVETTCRGIRPHLVGKHINHVEIHQKQLRWPVPSTVANIDGLTVNTVERRAKYILIHCSPASNLGQNDGKNGDMSLIIHLGMSGSLRITDAATPLKKHDHLVFQLSDGQQMRYHDPRRFGCVLSTHESCDNHKLLAKLGPEPLGETFTLDYFIHSCQQSKRAIKLHIMANAIVVGIGNIYACESLFLAGIHPTRPASNISTARLESLYHAVRLVLQRSIEQGGTTLKDFTNSDGQPGYFQQQLEVYGREGKSCHNCNTIIKRITLGQRSTFYCHSCQK